jgi:hypothetical protein
MLNNSQITLIQIACKVAGIRSPGQDGRYRLLLAQYRQPSKAPVTSCKQLNNSQMEDLLAICEANGWRMPGKPEDFYRQKVAKTSDFASFAQQSAIKHLAGDLGWNEFQIGGMIKKMTNSNTKSLPCLFPNEAYKVIEALKAMLGRKTGKQFNNLQQVKEEMSHAGTEGATDGNTNQI